MEGAAGHMGPKIISEGALLCFMIIPVIITNVKDSLLYIVCTSGSMCTSLYSCDILDRLPFAPYLPGEIFHLNN